MSKCDDAEPQPKSVNPARLLHCSIRDGSCQRLTLCMLASG